MLLATQTPHNRGLHVTHTPVWRGIRHLPGGVAKSLGPNRGNHFLCIRQTIGLGGWLNNWGVNENRFLLILHPFWWLIPNLLLES